MAKKDKEIITYEPGSDIVIPCIGQCGGSMTLKPSGEGILPKQASFICAECGGLGTKFKMQEEKAENVREVPPGQKRIGE